MEIATITTVLDLIGVCINGLLGGVVARHRGFDLFGFAVIGVVSGLGGGVVRDVLLMQGPPVALTNALYVPTALAGTAVAFLLKFTEQDWHRLFLSLDALALSVWAIAGAQKTLAAGLGWVPAILLGTLTAVGGGAIRDLLVQRVPSVFGGNELYASVAIIVASVYVVCSAFGAVVAGTVLGIVVGTLLRLLAARRGWGLPVGMPYEARAVFGKVRRSPRPRPPRNRARRLLRRKKDEEQGDGA
ncbi:trimeric intracellular cation channel family protein [Actinocorallia sp. A-T 12471]|uniref:trimeric intracellular cation channel family protein n=1 Tax=Actinocorallia sp. A-T 12471 TaxID=3089813 RepID=UPI0029CFB249|nr:TRIC cation channel family protein [Actinocorallia sp. A-T 12471]MDX6739184.1 TRIC cation channel family protein [Actinocorallia sp. A-T 12471]